MRLLLRALVLLAIFGGVSLAFPKVLDWRTYDCPEGRFSVSVPGQPEVTSETNRSPVGDIDEHTRRWRTGEVEWVVVYTDVPDAATAFSGSMLFIQVRRGFQRTTGQPVKNESTYTFDGHPGRSFEFHFHGDSGRDSRAGLARTFLVGCRLFVLTVTWDRPEIPPSAEEGSRFFDSFRLYGTETKQ